MVNTAKAPRRTLRFDTLPALRADLDALERAAAAGSLKATGNWTPGQIATHLAAFIDYAYDGYPPSLANPPWIVKFIMKFRKNAFLNKGLPAGVKIPGIKDGTVGTENASTTDGFARLRTALARLEKSAPEKPNVIFGPLTHDEWTKLHLRHAELHLSFLSPG